MDRRARYDALVNNPNEAFLLRWSNGNWWPSGADHPDTFTDTQNEYLAHFIANALTPEALRNYDEFMDELESIKAKEFKSPSDIGLNFEKASMIAQQYGMSLPSYIKSKSEKYKREQIDKLYERYGFTDPVKEHNHRIEEDFKRYKNKQYLNEVLKSEENNDNIKENENSSPFWSPFISNDLDVTKDGNE